MNTIRRMGVGSFSGVSQIVRFNWPFYATAISLIFVSSILLARMPMPPLLLVVIFVACAVAAYFALASLAVSYFVYDYSPLYKWNWIAAILPRGPRSFANLHAGLDQSSVALQRLFPDAHCRILDVHSAAQMSESSIERARRSSSASPASEPADFANLPLADRECDTIFLIFAAHELRSPDARLTLFRELYRSLQPSGSVVLVEHLRDWKNFLAYGPGAFHFFSQQEWIKVATQAGFRLSRQRTITPFVACFVLSRD